MGNLFWVHWCRKSLKSCQHNALQASSVKQSMTLLLCVSESMTTETSVPATFTNAFNCSSHQQLILSAVCSIIYVPIMSLPIEYNPITTTQMYTHYFIYYLNESYLHSKYSAVSLLNKTFFTNMLSRDIAWIAPYGAFEFGVWSTNYPSICILYGVPSLYSIMSSLV